MDKKFTLWADPRDGGLRAQTGHWPHPREAVERRGSWAPQFNRLTRSQEEILVKTLKALGKYGWLPQSPGEVSHLTLPYRDLPCGELPFI